MSSFCKHHKALIQPVCIKSEYRERGQHEEKLRAKGGAHKNTLCEEREWRAARAHARHTSIPRTAATSSNTKRDGSARERGSAPQGERGRGAERVSALPSSAVAEVAKREGARLVDTLVVGSGVRRREAGGRTTGQRGPQAGRTSQRGKLVWRSGVGGSWTGMSGMQSIRRNLASSR